MNDIDYVKRHLESHEIICDKCGGVGQDLTGELMWCTWCYSSHYPYCSKCDSSGKVGWIENILRT